MDADGTLGPRVAVVGSGYVGTVAAACLAAVGRRVVGLERDLGKLAVLRSGRAPFFEPLLDQLLASGIQSGHLRFTADVSDAMDASDVVFLCVGTPQGSDGHPDMAAMTSAAEALAPHLRHPHVLVTKSTVPIGTGDWLGAIIEEGLPSGQDGEGLFSIVSCPEFLREGSSVTDFLHPDRVVLGSDDAGAIEQVAEVYRPILEQTFAGGDPACKPDLVCTSLKTAETVKYAANAFLATKISFINEIANICELVGSDVAEVATALGLDGRIGRRFLDAGVGWGGSCFAKDVTALIATASEHGYRPELLEATVAVNLRQRALVVEKLRRHLTMLHGRRVALLGLAFKAGTDDLRDAPSVDVARWLLDAGVQVSAHDPIVRAIPGLGDLDVATTPYEAARQADAVVVLTDWPEYLELDLARLLANMRGDVLIDGRNMLDPAACQQAGFVYEGIGRHVPRATPRERDAVVLSLLAGPVRPRRQRVLPGPLDQRRLIR